jgi:NAD+ diphosphatase
VLSWDIGEAPGQFDRLGREERLDDRLVRSLWESGALVTVGPGPSVGVTGSRPAAKDHWLVTSRALFDGTEPSGESALAVTPTGSTAYDPSAHVLVGTLAGRGLFVDLARPERGQDLRRALGFLPPAEAVAAVTAVALVTWHGQAGFCPRCGAATRITAAGASRRCDGCAEDLFPRTDPAVIVAVTDDADRLLLAHQVVWEPGRYSVVAGFVEAGESLEQAVRREVLEETGVVVDRATYVASQPWPFPRSLMLGFAAHAATTALSPDGAEIERARWFARADLVTGLESGQLSLPGPASIAYRLIKRWWDAGAARST